MTRLLWIISLVALLTSCKDEQNAETKSKTETSKGAPQYFGEKITELDAIPTDSLKNMMGTNTELACKLQGKIATVCQTKGCWMELKNNDGTAIRVTFKDYAFFMPKDAAGLTAIVDGVAKVEVTSVADLQEYAKDDGKSKEEIAAITEPLKELVFEAKGVILK
jgi:hypothetical protein